MFPTKEGLESLLRTLDVWVIVFGVFVAIGVAGESIVGFIHFRKSSQLHQLQTAENLAQQAEIERLRNESASIRSDTANALERAAHAEKQAAELNKQAENERMARLKIEERMAPRQFDAELLPAAVAKLSAFKGYRADIGAMPETFENVSLANQLQAVLAASHWSASIMQAEAAGPLGGIPRGVMVRYTSDNRSKAAATALVEALQEEKIFAFLSEGLVGPLPSASHEDPYIFRILVVVGSKP